jgi:hypothetical protein
MEIDVTRPSKLYRYSERKWLERSLRLGEFRLRPASDYKDMESAAARTDDERHRKIVLVNPSITHVRTGRPIVPLGDVVMSSEIATDYLTLCFAKINSDHFYQDFPGSDACLVIHNPNMFFDRVYKAIDSAIPVGWGAIDGPVTYGSRSNLGTPFMKPEKFVFQFEWRFACLPVPAMSKCTAALLTIGSIADIAEVVAAPAGATQLTNRSTGRQPATRVGAG